MARSRLTPSHEAIYAELNRRLDAPGRRKNVFVVARAYLRQQKLGKPTTPAAVIDAVYKEDCPRRGWPSFDRSAWETSAARVGKVLASDDPEAVFDL